MGLFSASKPSTGHALPNQAGHHQPQNWQSQAMHLASGQAKKAHERKEAQDRFQHQQLQAKIEAQRRQEKAQKMSQMSQQVGGWAGDHKQELEGGAALLGAAALIGEY